MPFFGFNSYHAVNALAVRTEETDRNNPPTGVFTMAMPHLCARCLDVKSPVESQNGHSVRFGEAGEVQVEFYLHYKCADSWWQAFRIVMPPEFRLTNGKYN